MLEMLEVLLKMPLVFYCIFFGTLVLLFGTYHLHRWSKDRKHKDLLKSEDW